MYSQFIVQATSVVAQTTQTMQVLGAVLQKTSVPGEPGPAYDSALLHYHLTYVPRPPPRLATGTTASAALQGQMNNPDGGTAPTLMQVGGMNVSVQLCEHSSTGDVLCAYGGTSTRSIHTFTNNGIFSLLYRTCTSYASVDFVCTFKRQMLLLLLWK